MTINYSPRLKAALLDSLVPLGVVQREGKAVMRFDSIRIEPYYEEDCTIMVTYCWQGKDIFHLYLSGQEISRPLTLTGFVGETEISIE